MEVILKQIKSKISLENKILSEKRKLNQPHFLRREKIT